MHGYDEKVIPRAEWQACFLEYKQTLYTQAKYWETTAICSESDTNSIDTSELVTKPKAHVIGHLN